MSWAWLAVDLDGTILDDLHSATERSCTWRLRDQGDADVDLPSTPDGQAGLIDELRTDLVVTWQDRAWWRGRFAGSDDELDEEGESVSFGAVDYRGVLEGRLALEDLSWEDIDIAEAAWRLVRWTQHEAGYPGGLLGPGLGRGPLDTIATGDVEVAAGQTIAAAIDDVSKRYPGFDWWTDADMLLQASRWRGSTAARDFPLIWGDTVTRARRNLDVATYANLIRQTGGSDLDAVIETAADLAGRPEGRWEQAEANPDLATQDAVAESALVSLARAGHLHPQWTFTVRDGVWTPDDLWIGDLVRVVVRSNRHDVDTFERVTEITVTDDGDDVTVDITVGNTLAADVAAFQRRLPARLTQLARR
jgi:hypothetical protein